MPPKKTKSPAKKPSEKRLHTSGYIRSSEIGQLEKKHIVYVDDLKELQADLAAVKERINKLELTDQILNSWDRRIGALERPLDKVCKPEYAIGHIEVTMPKREELTSPLNARLGDLASAMAEMNRYFKQIDCNSRFWWTTTEESVSGMFFIQIDRTKNSALWTFASKLTLADWIRAEIKKHEGKEKI